ncbi:MAG: ATP-binding protein [Acidobacteria bacterium]|nr:ATP-binding protein [Acidobacteriota bacterium]
MGERHRLLIVDLDPVIQEQLAAALAAPGRHIEHANSAGDAVMKMNGEPFDLVISNADLLEAIVQVQPSKRVILMTCSATPESVVRAIRERAYSYVAQPFTLQSVVDLVETALYNPAGDDDIEVLSAKPDWLSLRLRCKLETADRILPFVHGMGTGLGEPEQLEIATAFREILLNAIEHGGGSDPRNKVTLTFARSARALYYYVRDPGPGFSFEKLAHAAVANPEESPIEHVRVREEMGMRPGGYGLLMTRNLVDEMIHNEAGNEVLLIKYLPNANEDSKTAPRQQHNQPEPRE